MPTSSSNLRKGQGKTQEHPIKSTGTLTNNQFDALQVEEGIIPDLESQNKEDRIEGSRSQSSVSISPIVVEEVSEKAPNRSTSPGGNWAEMVATYKENMEKTYERSPSPGGTWEEMVKQSKINPKLASQGQSSSQETQEATGLGPSQATRGRKSQKQQREQEAERELEL